MPTKICLVKAMVFPVVMYECELDHKGWVLKNWCLWTVVLEKTLESPLDSQEIKLVNHKGNQPWMFIGRTDVEAEAPILWPPDAKSPLLLLGKIEGRRRGRQQRMRWLVNGHEFEQTLRVGEGPGKPGVLQSMGSQRVGHNLATEQQKQRNLTRCHQVNLFPCPENPQNHWRGGGVVVIKFDTKSEMRVWALLWE